MELIYKIFDHGSLCGGTQITGVQSVKGQPFFLPMYTNSGNIICQIPECPARKTPGVGGKNSRGNDSTFQSHGRKHGQGNGQGTFAKTGNILNGHNTCLFHHIRLEIVKKDY